MGAPGRLQRKAIDGGGSRNDRDCPRRCRRRLVCLSARHRRCQGNPGATKALATGRSCGLDSAIWDSARGNDSDSITAGLPSSAAFIAEKKWNKPLRRSGFRRLVPFGRAGEGIWPGRNRTGANNAAKIGVSGSPPSLYSQRYSRDFWFPVRAGSVLILLPLQVGFPINLGWAHILKHCDLWFNLVDRLKSLAGWCRSHRAELLVNCL